MLKHLHLENFKAFRQLDLPLRPLTLLTGVNSMGKSSVLQALLLLRQSYQRQPYPEQALNLHLNAHLVQMGTANDVFYKLMLTPSLSLGLALDEAPQTALWRYAFGTAQENILKAQASPPPQVYEQALFSDNFHYLQADRFGPQVFYASDDDQVTQHRQLGKQGELTPSFLLYWGLEKPDTFPVYPELQHPRADGEANLLSQLEAWLGEISPASRLRTSRLEDTDAVSLRFSGQGQWLRPTNVGFGLSYTLPILTALLTIRHEGLVLLENPEAHLHPRGQSKIGELMTRAVAAGAQVLAETHSDHVLNTVRVAVKEGRLAPEDLQIIYFHRPHEEIEAVLPQLHADGGFTNESDLPAGFFDEFENTLFKLL